MNIRLRHISTALWFLTAAQLVAQVVVPSEAAKIADIARDKDVVWLSLTTAITSIGFSAWLVTRMLKQYSDGIGAIRELRDELMKRPCVYSGKDK